MKIEEVTREDLWLIEKAMEALRPVAEGWYHTVGAALRCKNGAVFTGVNCDGIHGSCAEFIAVGAAVTAGNRDFDTIVAVDLSPSAPHGVVSPCGNCRQMMFEYCPDMRVIVNDENGRLIKVPARNLLPFAYVNPEFRESAAAGDS